MSQSIKKIGIIGLDTSHVTAFTELLNDENHAHHIKGGRIVAAYPGGSPDFELSISRVEGFTAKLRDDYGVAIMDTPEQVAEASDAILLESVDGRVHLEQFKRIAPYGKPVFIDKPFTVNAEEAAEIAALAQQYNVPVMTSSALRYADSLTTALESGSEQGAIIGADCIGPMLLQPTQPGLFWYGIHTVEMLYTVMGSGCRQVTTFTTELHDEVVGVWADGRIGTIRGNRCGNNGFMAMLHREKGSQFVNASVNEKPYYASMLTHIMALFETGHADVPIADSVEIIRFIEAANESRETGLPVQL